MTTADLVNLINRKFQRVEYEKIWGNGRVAISHAGNRYLVFVSSTGQILVQRRFELQEAGDNYTRWVEGVLNGQVRNEAGELVKAC